MIDKYNLDAYQSGSQEQDGMCAVSHDTVSMRALSPQLAGRKSVGLSSRDIQQADANRLMCRRRTRAGCGMVDEHQPSQKMRESRMKCDVKV